MPYSCCFRFSFRFNITYSDGAHQWHFDCQCSSRHGKRKLVSAYSRFWCFIHFISMAIALLEQPLSLWLAKEQMCLNFRQDNFRKLELFATHISYRSCKLQWPEKCFWQSWQNDFICFSCGWAFLVWLPFRTPFCVYSPVYDLRERELKRTLYK